METQYFVLGYRIDLCFHVYEPAIGHSNRNIDYEIKNNNKKQ